MWGHLGFNSHDIRGFTFAYFGLERGPHPPSRRKMYLLVQILPVFSFVLFFCWRFSTLLLFEIRTVSIWPQTFTPDQSTRPFSPASLLRKDKMSLAPHFVFFMHTSDTWVEPNMYSIEHKYCLNIDFYKELTKMSLFYINSVLNAKPIATTKSLCFLSLFKCLY